MEGCNKIQADARSAVYCAGVIGNDAANIEFLHQYWDALINDGNTHHYFQYELDSVANGLSCVTESRHLQE